MKYQLAIFFSLLTSICLAAPPDVPTEYKIKPGQVLAITVKTDKKIGSSRNFKAEDAFFGELVAPAGTRQFMFQAPLPEVDATGKVVYKGKSQYVISWWTEGELEGVSTTVIIEGQQPLPPTPPVPPTPPTPVPGGFRVIYVYETSQQITPSMQQVMFGEKVRAYLDTKTIKNAATNVAGWRRYDPDVNVTNEKDADIKAIWNAAKPHLTNVPCVVIAAGTKVDIVPFPANEDEALALFKKYGG